MTPLDLLLGTDALTAAPQQPQAQAAPGLIAPPRPAYSAGFVNLPSAPAAPPQAQAPAQAPPPDNYHHGLGGFLRRMQDALLAYNGLPAMHYQEMQQQRTQSALQGFLANPDQAITKLMQVDAPTAVELYTKMHPQAAVPAAMQEWEAYSHLPADQQAAFLKFRQALNPQIVSPFTMPEQGGTFEIPGSGAGALPHVSDQAGYDALPDGARYTTGDGTKILVKGGATASAPSRTFPDR